MIPFLDLHKINLRFETEFKNGIQSFLDSGYYILGENVVAFETEFANYCGVKHCIGVALGYHIHQDFRSGFDETNARLRR